MYIIRCTQHFKALRASQPIHYSITIRKQHTWLVRFGAHAEACRCIFCPCRFETPNCRAFGRMLTTSAQRCLVPLFSSKYAIYELWGRSRSQRGAAYIHVTSCDHAPGGYFGACARTPKMSHFKEVFVAVGTYDSTVICLSFDAEQNVRKSRSQMMTVQNSWYNFYRVCKGNSS